VVFFLSVGFQIAPNSDDGLTGALALEYLGPVGGRAPAAQMTSGFGLVVTTSK